MPAAQLVERKCANICPQKLGPRLDLRLTAPPPCPPWGSRPPPGAPFNQFLRGALRFRVQRSQPVTKRWPTAHQGPAPARKQNGKREGDCRAKLAGDL